MLNIKKFSTTNILYTIIVILIQVLIFITISIDNVYCYQQQNHQLQSTSSQYHQNANSEKCCACDEAKYELVFEGLWSRYTHSENFPENHWLAYFGDVIGASHSSNYVMWAENQYASDGVKELAQYGSTKKLEFELKQVSPSIRTIIKAREMRFPILNSKTFAVFRTDRQHHLVSILSKLGPSPDWMVGVSSLNLCQSDCTWSSQRVVNLNLWDAGTDSGELFAPPDMPKIPPDPIRPYKFKTKALQTSINLFDSNYNDSFNLGNSNQQKSMHKRQVLSSSSLNNSTTLTKPFARLIITRQRVYEKACNDQSNLNHDSYSNYQSNINYNYKPQQPSDSQTMLTEYPLSASEQIGLSSNTTQSDCRVSEWSDWSACSSTCGKGLRTRIRDFISDLSYSNNCPRSHLIDKEECLSECIGNVTCITKAWSAWSECSVSCGHGFRQKVRTLIGPFKRACTTAIDLVEREACIGHLGADCLTIDNDATSSHSSQIDSSTIVRQVDQNNCKVSAWSAWSECSSICGNGTKARTRQYLNRSSYKLCSLRLVQKAPCTGRGSKDICDTSIVKDFCYDEPQKGPCNNQVQRWYYDKHKSACFKFNFGGCFAEKNNFDRYQDCYHICIQPIGNQNDERLSSQMLVDCVLGPWGTWSPCVNCYKTKHRKIIQRAQNGGRPCDKRHKVQRCKEKPQCTTSNNSSSTNSIKLSKGSSKKKTDSKQLTTTTTTTLPTTTARLYSSMEDDEDDSKFSRLRLSENPFIVLTQTEKTLLLERALVHSQQLSTNATKESKHKLGEQFKLDYNSVKNNKSNAVILVDGRNIQPCIYQDWTPWSECEVVCKPTMIASTKIRRKIPISSYIDICDTIEEIYYCDPNIYC